MAGVFVGSLRNAGRLAINNSISARSAGASLRAGVSTISSSHNGRFGIRGYSSTPAEDASKEKGADAVSEPATPTPVTTPPFIAKPGSLKDQILKQYQVVDSTYNVKLPAWQNMLGENLVKTFNLDMDRIRSGPVAGALFKDMCKAQAFYQKEGDKITMTPRAKFYYETLGMPQTFNQWYQVTLLHVWILFVRMRSMPRKYCREYQQKLVNSIFEDIDFRLREEIKINSDRMVNNYKKGFNDQLRGSIFAYDEGFYSDDTVLAGALWRNLFESKKDIDMTHIEQLVHYVRTQLYVLDRMSDLDFAAGRFQFIDPSLRYQPLTEGEDKEIKSIVESNRKESTDAASRSTLSKEGW
ncbi:Cbp3p [Sugiyamaella lignohabitans]|uniref:Cbp3p n=1 Tax=Sugiyamaella lignohabitans TaxID=796027 RepID=A0A167C2L6_9ASCO|nr:Cbp3p [Sugiyamaella lignohabitans]ANB11143.1 Cbp3p [Sugiyamaella lignohabitans]